MRDRKGTDDNHKIFTDHKVDILAFPEKATRFVHDYDQEDEVIGYDVLEYS
jgi:hypothetical protein